MGARKAIAERKRAALVDILAARTRAAFNEGRITSLFGYEATHRHTIRSVLCLRGVSWAVADQMARDVVAEVLRVLVAKRPSWNEGQPEWTIESGTLIERTRCIRCHKGLPEGRYKYCSNRCGSGHKSQLASLKNATETAEAGAAGQLI